jgi:hypothetical protein
MRLRELLKPVGSKAVASALYAVPPRADAPKGKTRPAPEQPRAGRDETLRYLLGPHADTLAAVNQMFNPVETLGQSMKASQRMLAPDTAPMARVESLGDMLSGVAGFAAPMVGAAKVGAPAASAVADAFTGINPGFGADEFGGMKVYQPFDMGRGAAGPDHLADAYRARAEQMALPIKDRIQPIPGRSRVVDQDYASPAPNVFDVNLADNYPRNPDPSAPLPKGDRARVLVDRKAELSAALADKILATGQMGMDTRHFYHSDGPIYRAAINAGLSDVEAKQYLKDFSEYFAATSPRTKVEENLRNATSAMAKTAQGIPHRQIVGPGSGGVSEKGYPMMTNPGGIHGQLLDQVVSGRGIDTTSNPKPATFGGNMAGNRSGVTVDTHAIRGTLQTLNEMSPGSVPDGFILPEYRAQYAADPSKLTPNMIDDTLASQMVGAKGATYSAQTEYPVFADIWHGAADKLGVEPAEAQSMGWFGMGADTNLGSAAKTVADVFDERISVTSQALGISPQEAARLVFKRKIPLLAGTGAAFMAQQPRPSEAKPIKMGQ